MAREYISLFIVLVLLLVGLSTTPAHSAATGRDAFTSILTGTDRTVPDFVMKYAPLVWLHSEDPFRPADMLQHLRHTTPTIHEVPIANLPELDLDNLAVLEDVSDQLVALTATDDITTLPAWLFGKPPDEAGRVNNATPCVVILVEKSVRDIDAFFFYFYSYDRGPNVSQILEPLSRWVETPEPGMTLGDHVGDWEHNMVRFRDGKPIGIYYSQHSYGAAYDWDDSDIQIKDNRPVVFSAHGSHANYPSPGSHVHDYIVVDYCDAGLLWDPVLSAYFYHLDPTSFVLTRLFPRGSDTSMDANMTSFFYFTGLWGDAEYAYYNPRQWTLPWIGMKRFVSGPKGPAVKQLVRRGLLPDRRAKSIAQLAVGIFMSVYPCCLRGWRVWVSGTVLTAFLISTVLGIKVGLKRCKRRGYYKKIETEIPLDDLEPLLRDNDHPDAEVARE